MHRILFILALSLTQLVLMAQVPSTCFEIETLLVDACAFGQNCGNANDPACNCEGKNEMFRFIVGPDDLNTADMEVAWPNGFNDWLGVCRNATTEGHVADLNATIQNCGWLVEPVGGVLPAGEQVLMVTSTDMCTGSNSFAGLSDTLIIIFQCPGNYFGHFANQNNGGNNFRTLEVDFGQGCEDEVTYDRSLLVDQDGVNQPSDGATVNFTWAGDDSYVNNGCNAPVEQAIFDVGQDVILCPGENISLNAMVDNSYSGFVWSGGLGTFSDLNSLSTTYTPAANELDEFTLTLTAQGCDGEVSGEVQVLNLNNALTGITSSGGTAVCAGSDLTLTAEGSGLFNWNTGVVAPSIIVSDADEYTVSVSNSCGTFSESITITVEPLPTVEIAGQELLQICDGEVQDVEASGSGGTIVWSTGDSGAQSTIHTEGWHYATVTNECASAVDSVSLEIVPIPTVEILPEGPIELCEEDEIELIADAVGELLWSTGEMTPSITVSALGSVSVQSDNLCGTASDEVSIVFGGAQPLATIEALDILICEGETITLSGYGGDTYAWNGAMGASALTVSSPGEYVLTAINSCGEDQESITILADEEPEAILQNGPSFAICNGEDAQVQVGGNGSFTWSDGAIANSQVFSQTGEYYVFAETVCGTDTAYFTVVTEEISAQAFADPVLGEAPLTVDFSNETGNSAEVEWVFEQGELSSLDQSSYTFLEEANYEVVLTATSALGCESRTSIEIQVGACPFALFVPSAFTPDGDGVNDQLRAVSNCAEQFEWHIYDRWGREVFFSIDPQAPWTGADRSGYAVSNGEYPYWIQILDSNGTTRRIEGSIVVLR